MSNPSGDSERSQEEFVNSEVAKCAVCGGLGYKTKGHVMKSGEIWLEKIECLCVSESLKRYYDAVLIREEDGRED